MSMVRVAGGQVLFPDHRVERADVVFEQETGTIEAIGDLDSVPTGDRVLDAADGLVMPGLVNAHSHAAMTLLRGYSDDKPLDRWLQEDIWPVEAALDPADIRAGTALAAVELIRSGTTTLADMYFAVDTVVDVLEQAGLRARVGHGVVTVGKDEDAAAADVEEGIEVAAEFDGVADGRIRTAVMPHSLTTVSERHLTELVEAARELGVPVHLHVNETRDEVEPIVDEYGMRPVEYALEQGVLQPDDWIAHGVHLDATEIASLADAGASVVHCPASNMKLASGIAPVPELRDAGVTVAVGTDGAASNNDLDLFDELRDAALLGKVGADDASAVPADAVIEMATVEGAAALGFDTGRLAVGAPADLIVVDLDVAHLTPTHDVVSHLAYAARGSDVRHTVCDGQVLMQDREVLPLDEGAVRRQAADRAHALIERAGGD